MDPRLREFYNFLTDRKVKKGEPATHTVKKSQYENWFPTCYYIEDKDKDKFWSQYCDLVKKGYYLTLTELAERYGPLRIDADFEASTDNPKRQYTRQTLKKLVKIYQEEIKKIIDPNEFEERMLWCIVLEKESPRAKDEFIIKDGFHIHFPHFICDAWTQDIYLREKVIARMIEEGVWKGCQFVTQYKDIIDRNMFKKPWMLYGSMNYKGKESDSPYLYIPNKKQGAAFDHNQKQIKLRTLFSEEMIGRKRTTEYYLPEFLSIKGFYEKISLNEEKLSQLKEYKRKKRPLVKKTKSEVEIKETLREIKDKELLSMLSYERKINYDDWIRVGWALFNEAQGDVEALEMWKEFSECEKYIDGDCEDHWARMEMKEIGGYTMASLCFWAKEDSPQLFKDIKYYSVKKYCLNCLYPSQPNEYDVAMVVCEKYKHRFKCAGAKRNLWYEFKNHKWAEIEGEIPLRQLLPTEIANDFFDLRKEYNGSEDSSNELKGKRCYEIVNKLKTSAFQNKVIDQCKLKLYDGDFFKKIDEDKMLVGCENGVLDLRLLKFRPGDPGDYITFSNGNCYDEDIKPGSAEDRELEEYLEKLFPNPNLRTYFLDFMCSCLRGGNIHKTFLIKTGGGNNGKSVMVKLIEKVFGDYCGKFPRELLVRGKSNNSGSARPELARIRGKRIMFCQEIGNSMDDLNVGVLKELTGNDSFFTRSLFEKGTEISPQFSLILQCLAAGTQISLPSGITLPIESLMENTELISWDESSNGLVPSKQSAMLIQGVKDCVTLTLEDGREITCTPNHRFLNFQGKWIEAQDIVLNETELTMGVHQPRCNLTEEIIDFDFPLVLETVLDKLKAMAVCRLLGYQLADGSLNIQVYMGHLLDAEKVIEDIYFLTGKRPVITRCNSCWKIHIPRELSRIFDKLSSRQPGGRINNPSSLPKFIFDKNCPDFLIKEFVAGLFGGDGMIPRVQKNSNCETSCFTPLGLIASKANQYIPSLIESFEKLSKLLKERFDITSSVSKPGEYEKGKSKVYLLIHRNSSTRKFIENIGFRYCCHKEHRLTAVLSYKNYLEAINKQNNRILSRTKELVEKYQKQNPLPKIIQYDKDGKYLNEYESTQKAQKATKVSRHCILQSCKRNGTSRGFVWRFGWDKIATIENEPGCKTIKEALKMAISEQKFIFSKKYLITYTQVVNRNLKNQTCKYIINDIQDYLERTNLVKFCETYIKDSKKKKYTVDSESISLPTYKLKVIGRRYAGKQKVYDLTVDKYHNFIANGIVSHNCNDPPNIPGDDDATWNRIRIMDYESEFIKPSESKRVPKTFREQMKQKIFNADPCFDQKLSFLAPTLLWKLFNHYVNVYSKLGLREPKEVIISTNRYKLSNDVYQQFISEYIEKIEDVEEARKNYIKESDIHSDFRYWYKQNHPSYMKGIGNRNKIISALASRLGTKKDEEDCYGHDPKTKRFYGYKIMSEEGDFTTVIGKNK